jgi:hypothetical protein
MIRNSIGGWLLGLAGLAIACGSSGDHPSTKSSGGASGKAEGGGTTGTTTGGSGGMATGGGSGASGGASGAAGGKGGAAGKGTAGTTGGSAGKGAGGSSGSGATAGAISSGTGGAQSGAGAPDTGGLPSGNDGIAQKYPGDVGIEADADVLFADDFERYGAASELNDRYDAVYQNQYVSLTTEPDHVFYGKQALELTLPQQDAELSDSVDKVLDEEQDVLFLRYYSRFDPPYDVVGSSHNGSSISAHYFTPDGMATPGVPADGTNKFLANLENWRGDASVPSPGYLNVYIYHPDQRSMWGDHYYPNGEVDPNTSIPGDFGPDFVARPQWIPELDRWYCYELMVKANTPGELDGRIAYWVDGELKGDFPNQRLRDVASLTINRFGLSFHIHDNPNGESRKWYDNVVAAKSYIGPLVAP